MLLSSIYYPTSPLVVHQILLITEIFHENKKDEILGPVIVAILKELKKYWSEIPLLYALGLIFDPRIKLQGLTNALSHISSHLGY